MIEKLKAPRIELGSESFAQFVTDSYFSRIFRKILQNSENYEQGCVVAWSKGKNGYRVYQPEEAHVMRFHFGKVVEQIIENDGYPICVMHTHSSERSDSFVPSKRDFENSDAYNWINKNGDTYQTNGIDVVIIPVKDPIIWIYPFMDTRTQNRVQTIYESWNQSVRKRVLWTDMERLKKILQEEAKLPIIMEQLDGEKPLQGFAQIIRSSGFTFSTTLSKAAKK